MEKGHSSKEEMEKGKRSLEELQSKDGCGENRLVEEDKEIVNGDEFTEDELWIESLIKGCIDRLVRETKEQNLLRGKEKKTDYAADILGLSYGIPRRRRSSLTSSSYDVSGIGSNNKFVMESCSGGEAEEEKEIGVRLLVEHQRNADRLNKKRKFENCLEEEEMKMKMKKKKRPIVMENNELDLNPAPSDLPQEFKDQITRLNGTNVMLVAEKKVTKTDVDEHQSRFSVPRGILKTYDFLSEEETKKFDSDEDIPCSLIQPCLKVTQGMVFRKWKMNNTFSCILKKKWKEVRSNKENQLKGSWVRLWSFRVDEELWFAMVNLCSSSCRGEC